jgi:hypothetical protein
MDEDLARVATDLPEMCSRLKSAGLSFRERTVSNLGLHQIFFKDPSCVTIKLNFPWKGNSQHRLHRSLAGKLRRGNTKGERIEDRPCSSTFHLVKQIACHRNRETVQDNQSG